MTIPALNLYSKFGDPHRLAEFRIFSFNKCEAGCRNCFYQKSNNDFSNFEQVLQLAQELKKKEYSLETCYLQPTDVFENDFNYQVFDDAKLTEVLGLFNYVGLASTLRSGFDEQFLKKFLNSYADLKIELHVNLIENLLFDPAYFLHLKDQFQKLEKLGAGRILINLALNTGSTFTSSELDQIKALVEALSHDRILELNFTFLFNKKLSRVRKTELMKESYPLIHHFTDEFAKNERAFNQRTVLRKPSFVFKDNQIYLSPILPFDEYVFIDHSDYVLPKPDFDSFLEVYGRMENQNMAIWSMCSDCENLELCHGKGFFSVARFFNLECMKAR